MTASELKSALGGLGISQAEFARLIDVTPRAVSLWLAEDREFSGPAAAYLRLFCSLPRAVQAKEIARIRQEDSTMYEGMYSVSFQGATGTGLAALVLTGGRVFGSDGGVLYDGSYQPSHGRPGYVDAKVHLTVPPGIALVQGVPPQPMAYGFDLGCTFAVRGKTGVTVQTPYGPIQGVINFLRDVPTH